MGRLKDRDLGPPPPLSDFARHKVTMMRFFCGGLTCRHQADVPIAKLIEKLGPDATVEDVKRRGYCNKCGSREISVQPSWPSPLK
jgi:hypothetical protein